MQTIDTVVLTRTTGALPPEVERGIRCQSDVAIVPHRVVGQSQPTDHSRWQTIARARNEGKRCGVAPWLMFVDDDVVLKPGCMSALLDELSRRPLYGALAADYLGERCHRQIPRHVAMGATLFRREALDGLRFRTAGDKCECQCCCDDLREQLWGIDYSSAARAQHLRPEAREEPLVRAAGAHGTLRASGSPSICLVVCYFGNLPRWLDHFLVSCAFNPHIDFLFFTDQAPAIAAPPNVHVRQLTPRAFNRLASDKIGIRVELCSPQKVCDFKPMFGHLFESHLAGFDYWGYTDLDVVFGDLQSALAREGLPSYDVFTARKEYLVGHFTLWRNTPELRELYRQSDDLPATLRSPDVLSFDECGRQWRKRLEGRPCGSRAACDSMTHIVERLAAQGRISARFLPLVAEWPELVRPTWRFRWQSGRLWQMNPMRERMYVHFHAFKHNYGYRNPRRLNGASSFEISPTGFHPAR